MQPTRCVSKRSIYLRLIFAFGTVAKHLHCTGVTLPTLVRIPSRTWKAVIRKNGWPTNIKTFRTKRDTEDWRAAQRTRWYAVSISCALLPST